MAKGTIIMRLHDFASEKHHGAPRDNLTLDAMDAERAGMSYGKYKALHPCTKSANEARLAEMQANGKRAAKKRTIYVVECAWCGKTFETDRRNTKHCSDDCKREAKNRQWRIAHGSKKI